MIPIFNLPALDSLSEYTRWAAALAGSALGLARFLSGRSDTQAQNDEFVECHDYVLDTVTDADQRSRISCLTGKEIGDQLSVEEAEQIRDDAERRRWWPKNN